jgi:hypothetical protein
MSSSHLLLQIIPKWLLFYIIWWVLNLEYNSSLGNIWYRPDSSGKYIFAYKSIFSLNLTIHYTDDKTVNTELGLN